MHRVRKKPTVATPVLLQRAYGEIVESGSWDGVLEMGTPEQPHPATDLGLYRGTVFWGLKHSPGQE